MVCNRSLYCWKNGPCASDQARKQIWEDNIKFRRNLRDVNQSDHYWSFQISQNLCVCVEGEELFHGKQILKRCKSQSLQMLYDKDCASITHNLNGLKYRNCYVHCPKQFETKDDKVTVAPKRDIGTCTNYTMPSRAINKSDEKKSKFWERYKNTLSDTSLKPNIKMKFPSQMNLCNENKSNNILQKRPLHSSWQNISTPNIRGKTYFTTNENSLRAIDVKVRNDSQKNVSNLQLKEKEIPKDNENRRASASSLQHINFHNCDLPILQAQKTFQTDKRLPIVKSGFDSVENVKMSKKANIMFPAKAKVHLNSFLKKQQKNTLKYDQNNDESRKKGMLDNASKRCINHSSLWSFENPKQENQSTKNKNYDQLILLKKGLPKKFNKETFNLDFHTNKTYKKPHIYFY